MEQWDEGQGEAGKVTILSLTAQCSVLGEYQAGSQKLLSAALVFHWPALLAWRHVHFQRKAGKLSQQQLTGTRWETHT